MLPQGLEPRALAVFPTIHRAGHCWPLWRLRISSKLSSLSAFPRVSVFLQLKLECSGCFVSASFFCRVFQKTLAV